MKLAPGTPLSASLVFETDSPPIPTARLAMADGLAQLEWSREVIAARLDVSALLYPPDPGLLAARGRDFEGLHGFLADSLPEGWGYVVMRKRLAGLGVRIEELNPLDRLALVGDQGRGALTYAPATTPAAADEALDLDTLATESAAILAGNDSALIEVLARLAGGSGGARPKVHVGFDAEGAISVSAGETAAGHDAWIVKFPAVNDPQDIGPIEAAYADMAAAAGLTLSEHRLLETASGPPCFATRRFDRPAPGRRLHMVSLCGAIEARSDRPSASYDTFLRATLRITRHADDVAAAFRRMVFNVLACNRDDHTRQHAFLMDADGEWRLAPAYDLTFSIGPGGEHYLAIDGEGRNPTRDHVMRLGKLHGLTTATINEILEQNADAVAGWSGFASGAGVGESSRREVLHGLERVRNAFAA